MSQDAAPDATKWEYFTAPILSHAAQQILNNFGSQGWELVQVVAGPHPDTVVGYFKRPLAAAGPTGQAPR